MKLIHYSKSPLAEVRSASQSEGRAHRRGDKPNGLWVSVEGEYDWPSWCHAEGWGIERLATATQIVLATHANLLVIDTPEALTSFHRAHACKRREFYAASYAIDWEAVAKKHQGIIIAPYHWEHRLSNEITWYYGWDCASGCIWDASAVAELRTAPAAIAA